MTNTEDRYSFRDYRRQILGNIERIGNSVVKLEEVVTSVVIEIAQIKTVARTKATIWGSIGGSLVVMATLLTAFLMWTGKVV